MTMYGHIYLELDTNIINKTKQNPSICNKDWNNVYDVHLIARSSQKTKIK